MAKKYSFNVIKKIGEGKAFGYLEGFPASKQGEDVVVSKTRTVNGEEKEVSEFSIAVNSANKNFNYHLGTDLPVGGDDEVAFIRVTAWGREAERVKKLVRKGSIYGVGGTLTVSEYEGNKYLNLTLDDIKPVNTGKKTEGGSSTTGGSKADTPAEPEVKGDDDLPF